VSLGKLKRRLFRARLAAKRAETRLRFLRQMVKLSNFGFPKGLSGAGVTGNEVIAFQPGMFLTREK
jgi:hypothetical protein